MKIPVGKNAVENVSSEEVCIQEKCSVHNALADLPIDK